MKNSKKILASFLAAAFAAFSLAGCSSGEATAETEEIETPPPLAEKFIIGGIGPLTGDAASYGISVKFGAQVAVDEINAAGGINGMPLEIVFADDGCDEEKSVAAYKELKEKGAGAILGAVTSGCSLAVSEAAKEDGILQITPSASALDCTKYDNVFRICFTDPLQGELMAQYISEQGIKNPALIYELSDYSTGIRGAFMEKAGELGLTIAADESFESGETDFTAQLEKVKNSGADCLFLPIYYTEAAYIAEQAKAAGVSLPYFGCDGWDGIIKHLNGNTSAIEGAAFLTPFIASSESESVKSLVYHYDKSYDLVPDQFAADAYDGVYALKAAIEAAGSLDSGELIKAMTQIRLEGATGSMSFTAAGDPDKSAMVAVIRNGEYVSSER